MKCPDKHCGAKITAKHYDPTFWWYECPKCEGCFTYAEILEAEQDNKRDPSRNRVRGGSRNGRARDRRVRPAVVAKGKVRQQEIDADEELAEEQVKAISSKKVVSAERDVKHHRDELPTGQVINIMADEIQEIYMELGGSIDEVNARDKALTIWRELHIHGHVQAREQTVPLKFCKEHR